jgi:hypothetical protein
LVGILYNSLHSSIKFYILNSKLTHWVCLWSRITPRKTSNDNFWIKKTSSSWQDHTLGCYCINPYKNVEEGKYNKGKAKTWCCSSMNGYIYAEGYKWHQRDHTILPFQDFEMGSTHDLVEISLISMPLKIGYKNTKGYRPWQLLGVRFAGAFCVYHAYLS